MSPNGAERATLYSLLHTRAKLARGLPPDLMPTDSLVSRLMPAVFLSSPFKDDWPQDM